MYEVKENSRILKDGTEITTYIRDVVSCNILEVEAGTTGYCGGDTGHGGRTYFRIQDAACTDMEIHSYTTRCGSNGFEVCLGGDWRVRNHDSSFEIYHQGSRRRIQGGV